MGITDKAKDTVQKVTGQGKEKVGQATGDEQLEAEGRKDQVAGSLKKAGENVKDAFK